MPPGTPVTAAPQPVVGAGRGNARVRHFAGIDALIEVKERDLRRAVWEVPDRERSRRIEGMAAGALRGGQLAASARLAQARRVALTQRQQPQQPQQPRQQPQPQQPTPQR
ncbi:hypothetical protein [Pengzhenrongella frigida]|uniref:hypothetical protein n=1 Tax=Pengzhenrongella frigida TaxID=1259133 RepID=UPI0013E9C64E|nr:hypothetical protein [Cellulomonas sp. HLT2-17]